MVMKQQCYSIWLLFWYLLLLVINTYHKYTQENNIVMALTNQSQLQQLILIYKNHSQTQPLCCNNKSSIPHRKNKNSNQQYKHTFHKNNKKHKDKKTKHNKIYLNQLQYKNKNNWNNHMKYFRLNNNRYLHLIS